MPRSPSQPTSGDGPRRGELELFLAIGQGDEGALHEFNRRIERCVRWHVGRAAEAEIEEICDRVRERMERRRERGFTGNNQALRSYLYKVVASQSVEVRRERSRLVSLDAPVDLPGGDTKPLGALVTEMVDTSWDALSSMARDQEGHILRKALGRLDERCRRILLEREVEGRPEGDIASGLGISLANVWVSVHRCKDRLSRLVIMSLCESSDADGRAEVSRLAAALDEPLATAFRLWWDENRTIRAMAEHLGREEQQVKALLVRAKAAVWQLAQEATRQ